MKKSKGQVSHVFMTIFTLIVFATIFIFGYKAIGGIVQQGDEASFVQLKTDVEKAVRRVARDVDSVIIYNAKNQLRVPGKYKRVCFVDVDQIPPMARQPPEPCPPELGIIACDTWKTAFEQSDQSPLTPFDAWEHADANVFLEPTGFFPVKTTPIRVQNNKGYLCIATSGRLDLRLTGKGSYTLVASLS